MPQVRKANEMNARIEISSHRPSDDQLETLTANSLSQSPYRELRRVSCRVRGNQVTLTGRVSSFFYKQLAQEHVQKNLSGAVSLDNRLEVTSSPS